MLIAQFCWADERFLKKPDRVSDWLEDFVFWFTGVLRQVLQPGSAQPSQHLFAWLVRCLGTAQHPGLRFEVGDDPISQDLLLHLLLVRGPS